MSIVSETLISYWTLGRETKTTPSGWISGNAPCCIHNGETQDTKRRGGIFREGDNIIYHCFNCGFKASWQPGWNINYNMRKLMEWLNIPDDQISKLSLEALRLTEGTEEEKSKFSLPTFQTVTMPESTIEIQDDFCDEKNYNDVLQYMRKRNLWLNDGYKYFWCNDLTYRRRLIIPFYYKKRLVGWTARAIDSDTDPRYLMKTQPGFVYGLDEQRPNKIFCVVTEGTIDANHVEGVSIMGSEISEQQALLINRLNKDIIVVPDRDSKGKHLIEQAIDLGWSVSMPEWSEDCKDVSDAVIKYGRLYTLYSIASAAESSPLKIRLRMKKWII